MKLGRINISFAKEAQPVSKTSDLMDPEVKLIHGSDIAWANEHFLPNINIPEYNPDMLLWGKGFKIYQHMMNDEQVKSVVIFRRNAVTGREWGFELADARLSEEDTEFRIALFECIVRKLRGSFKKYMDDVMSSIVNGYSMVEKVYNFIEFEDRQWVGVKDLKPKPFSTFEFFIDEHGNLIKIEQVVAGKRLNINPAKFVMHVHNPDFHQQYGRSELTAAYRAWYSKNLIISFQNTYLERMAGGLVWADTSEMKSELVLGTPLYTSLQSVLSNINAKTGILMPRGAKLVVEHPDSTDAFERALAYYDRAIAKSLLMPELLGLSTQSNTGSYSQSQTQLEAFLWMLDAEATALEEVLNEQLFRELGDQNFGDGIYPEFKLKPLSESKKVQLIDTWLKMVAANAVDTTDSDKKHLRNMIGFPEPTEEEIESQGERVDQGSAMNGAQVSALVGILEKVSTAVIAPEAAVILINESFPISEERAKEMVDKIEIKEPEPMPIPGQDPNAPPGKPGDPNAPPVLPKPGEQPPPKPGDPPAPDDETIAGQNSAKIEAALKRMTGMDRGEFFKRVMKARMSKAAARVDFKVLDARQRSIVEDYVPRVSKVIASIVKEATESVVDGGSIDPKDVESLKVSKENKGHLRRLFDRSLREGWELGQRHAKDELLKIERIANKEFSINHERLASNAADFFDAKSFSMAGKFTEDSMSSIKNAMLNGMKAGKTREEIISQIYKDFSSNGLLTEEDVRDALGEAFDMPNPDARLRTVINTNTFEAINESRYSYFTDPSLDGFVEALEYSAVLDSRTTQICEHLDGKVFIIDGEVWGNGPTNFRPPNHFNCRSLLIPITEIDDWSEDDFPSMDPQRGFE